MDFFAKYNSSGQTMQKSTSCCKVTAGKAERGLVPNDGRGPRSHADGKKYSISLETGRQLTVRLSRVFHRDRYGGRNGYLVRSLYFDSIYDDDYFDKINGLEYRKKIRLRIYDPDQDWAKLEVKEKRGSVQVKSP